MLSLIKVLREETGLGLAASKQIVEDYLARHDPDFGHAPPRPKPAASAGLGGAHGPADRGTPVSLSSYLSAGDMNLRTSEPARTTLRAMASRRKVEGHEHDG